jgi:hypothetical protein
MGISGRYFCAGGNRTRLLATLMAVLLMPAAGWSQACIKTIESHVWSIGEVYELPDGRFMVNSYYPPLIYDSRLAQFNSLPGGAPDGLQSIHRLEGQDLWIAFARDGISRFDPVKGTFSILDGGTTILNPPSSSNSNQPRFSLFRLEPDLWLVSAVFYDAAFGDPYALGTRFSLLHAGARKITQIPDGQFAGFISGQMNSLPPLKPLTALGDGRSVFSTGYYPKPKLEIPMAPSPVNGADALFLDAKAEQLRPFEKGALPEGKKDRLGDITAVAKIDDTKWLLGTNRALYWFDLPTLTLHLLKDEMSVSAISSSQPVWIVVSEKGLDRFQPGTQQISPIESAAMGKVNDVAEFRAGRLLIAADRGVFVLRSTDSLPVSLQGGTNVGRVTKLRSVGSERWLVEADEGLYLFNAATEQLKTLAETDRNIGAIQEYRDLGPGTVLIRTDRLYRLDAGKETLEVLPLGVSRVSRVLSGESNGYLLETSRGWLVVDADFSNGRFIPAVPSSPPKLSTDLGQGRIIFDPFWDTGLVLRQPVTFSDPSSCK